MKPVAELLAKAAADYKAPKGVELSVMTAKAGTYRHHTLVAAAGEQMEPLAKLIEGGHWPMKVEHQHAYAKATETFVVQDEDQLAALLAWLIRSPNTRQIIERLA